MKKKERKERKKFEAEGDFIALPPLPCASSITAGLTQRSTPAFFGMVAPALAHSSSDRAQEMQNVVIYVLFTVGNRGKRNGSRLESRSLSQ